MIYPKLLRSLSFIAPLLISLTFSACAAHESSSSIQAVEVGNPEDSPGKKPSQPLPMRLVQLELETASLEEISSVELRVETIQLEIDGASRKLFSATSVNAQKGAILKLEPATKNVIEFSIPAESLQSVQSLKVALKFNEQKPGQVLVGANAFQIEQQSEALRLLLSAPSDGTTQSTKPLKIKRNLSKNELFEAQNQAIESSSRVQKASTSSASSGLTYRLRK